METKERATVSDSTTTVRLPSMGQERKVTARHATTCPECQLPINEGDEIRKDSYHRRWTHANCGDASLVHQLDEFMAEHGKIEALRWLRRGYEEDVKRADHNQDRQQMYMERFLRMVDRVKLFG